MLIRSQLIAFLVVATLAIAGRPSAADETKPAVSLVLNKASAEQRELDILFTCETTIENATGKDLTVRSNFNSVFDGLVLVVTDRKGKVLAQQPYTFHQSPFSPPGRDFTLKQGSTCGTLVFPIRGLSPRTKTLKVRLVGTLPGSDYPWILSSETIEVEIKE